MRKFKYIISLVLPALLLFFACEPKEEGLTEFGAPDPNALNFEIIKVDTWNFRIINKSSINGIAHFYVDNALVSDNHDTISIYQKKAGEYKVKMSLYTRGGSATSPEQTFIVTEDAPPPPFDYVNDPFSKTLTNGSSRVWVFNPEEKGHLGVGAPDTDGPNWWSANPWDKASHPIYDDEFTFTLTNNIFTVDAKGQTHAGHAGADEGRAIGYYGANTWSDQYDEDLPVDDSKRGTIHWSLQSVVVNNVAKYKIVFDSPSAVLGYDMGSFNKERIYEVIDWKANEMINVRTKDHDGNYRYGIFMPKDLQAVARFNVSATATGNENEYKISIADLVLTPLSLKVDEIKCDFGDGDAPVILTDATATVNHVYMRKGDFTVIITMKAKGKEFTATKSVHIANYHSTYVPYLLNNMVMYQDFGQTSLVQMAFDKSGNDGSIITVANPDASKYPNRSANVGYYTKINSQWANAYLKLTGGHRFNLTKQTAFRMLVYGKAGDEVLLKLENTDRGGNAWQTGAEKKYTIQKTNTWEVATFDFAGVGCGGSWTGDIFTSDITTDSRFNETFYNVIRIMYKPGDNSATFSFYLDDLAGPHVEGL